jgi:hypothetical protein
MNPLNNADDSHDPYFSHPDEFDIAYEDRVCAETGESDFDPDFYEDPYWGD